MSATYDHHDSAGWSIRRWSLADSKPVLRIFDDCLAEFPWRTDKAAYRRDLVRACASHSIFIAEEPSAGVVGFMLADLAEGYVPYLFIDIDWRLCGIGTGFLALARRLCGKPLTLDCDAGNTAALAAYEALGWQVAVGAPGRKGRFRQIRLVSP